MNTLPLEPVRWSRRRWWYSGAAIFLLQVGLVFYLGQRPQRPPERPLFRTRISLAADEAAAERLARRVELEDPALLALPSLQGFSGPAWLRFAALDYQPAEGSEPIHWLGLDTNALGETFARFVLSNRVSPTLFADRPLPSLLRYEPNFPNDPVPAQSRLRITGDLANRPLLTPIPLKSWPHSELLSNTVVQAMIDPDGFTVSTVLVGECGLNAADRYALEMASDARYRPLFRTQRNGQGGTPLVWGQLLFEWHTLPIPDGTLPAGRP